MANDILGSELNIDGLIEVADKAQKAMDKVADSAEGAGKKISDVFKSISTQGIDTTLQKLYDLQVAYSAIANTTVRTEGMKEIATNAKTAVDEVNKLIEALSKAYGTQSPTSTTAESQAENNRYNEWLRQKHEEEQIHKQIEDRKTQATRSAIAEQNQAYAEATAKKDAIAKDNSAVKTNAEVAKREYEQQLRMYENLFAQAEKNRPDLIDVAKTRSDINSIDSQLDKLMDRINRLNNEMQLFKSMESGKTLKTEDYAHIGRVSDELNKLMAQYEALDRLKTAMSSKGGFEQAIADLSGVSIQAERSKQALDDLAQSYRTGTSAFHQQMKTPEFALDFSKNAKTIEEERQAIQLLKQARENLDKTTPEGKKKTQELTDAIAQHEKNLKRATQSTEDYNASIRKLASQRLERIYSKSPNLAMNFSQNAKSINDQILAIKRLKSARDNLNRGGFSSEEAYRKKVAELTAEIKRQQTAVDKLRGKQEGLGKSHRSLMNTADQLTRKLALLFSVSAIQGYVSKLISVRGEFELQAKSLEVLLQNRDEANKLWNQTVQLAVKSPFTVKELVTYTKQLAAYRIESDKLYETNKMLADVSAGLGVDMNRLILAYGQVKAANFLRGTELRQFSEAGVNMLDELAKRFTALEGRAVSVGDVFERISKRMVSFADVEAVFKTITSEGGAFYQMQEKQAETLRGMVSNLKDQIDLMLNDVGMSNEGLLKGLVQMTVALVKNWRSIVPIIDAVAGILITRILQKGMMGILRMTKGVIPMLRQWSVALRGATAEATAMGTTLSKVTKANAWLALIGLVASLGYAIYDVVTSASKLEEELGRIDIDLTQRLEKSIQGYINLSKTATDSTKTMQEQRDALAKLNSAYGDILPQYMLTHNYLKQLNGDYKEVTDAIRLYYETQAIEQKRAKVEELKGEDIITNTTDLIGDIKDVIKDSKLSQELQDYLLSSVAGAVNSVVMDVKSGKVRADDISKEIFNRIAKGSGLTGEELRYRTFFDSKNLFNFEQSGVVKNIGELTNSLISYLDAVEGIEGLPKIQVPLAEKSDFEKAKANFDTLNQISNEWINIAQRIANGETTIIESFDELNKADLSQFSTDVSLAMTTFKQSLIDSANKGVVAFSKSLPTIKQNFLNTISGIIQASYQGNTAVQNLSETISGLGDKDELGNVAKGIYNIMEQISNAQGVDLDIFAKIIPSATQSLEEYKNKVKEYYEQIQEAIKIVNDVVSAQWVKEEALTRFDVKSAEELDALGKTVKLLADALGAAFKTAGGGGRSRDIISEQVKLIRDAQKAYQDLNKDFNEGESKTKVIDSYADAFKEIGLNINDIDFTNVDGVVEALENLRDSGNLTATQMALVNKAIAEVNLEKERPEVQAETKALFKDIEKMFDQYDLSLELDKLNIPHDLANKLFGVETTKLSKIRSKIEEEISQTTATERLEGLQKLLEKVDDMEQQAQIERLKKYSKYLVKGMNERVKIKSEELRQIAEVEKEPAYTQEQKKTIKTAIQKETQEKLDKQAWKEFTGSDYYIEIFADLDKISTSVIKSMLARLNSLKDSLKNLDATEMKQLVEAMEKMDKELQSREGHSFKDIASGFKEYFQYLKQRKNLEKQYEESQNKIQGLEINKMFQADAVALAEQAYNVAVDTYGVNSEQAELLQADLIVKKAILDATLDQLVAEGKISAKLAEQIKKGNTIKLTLEQRLQKNAQDLNEGFQAFSGMMQSIQSVTDTFAEDVNDFIENVGKVVGGITTVENGLAQALDGKVVTGALNMVSGAFQAIGGFFGFGNKDKKRERQIQRETEALHDLERAYEKLDKKLSEASDFNAMKYYGDVMRANLQQQIDSRKRMIEAEAAKKDSDDARIKQWREEIEDMQGQIDELNKQLTSRAQGGVFDDVEGVARRFTDAWLEAFNETGKGITGLEDSFDELFLDLIKHQASMKIVSKYVQNWSKQLDNYINEHDMTLSISEAEALADRVQKELPYLDESLTNFFTSFKKVGIDIGETASSTLSGLEKGIQGITEEQADVIASYLNSIRFYVSQIANAEETLAQPIIAFFSDENVVNPMLSQLKIQTELIRSIERMFGSVIRQGGHPTFGGAFIKVAM